LEDLADWFKDKLAEGSAKWLSRGGGSLLDPLLGFSIKIVVTPKSVTHLVLINTKLLGVHTGELVESESPTLKTSREGDVTLFRIARDITKKFISVGRDNNVGVLNYLDEILVHLFWVELKLKETTIELVNGQYWYDSFS
jgi:hypothetical protein